MNQLKRKALLLIANNMAPEEVAGLRSIFQVGGCCPRRRSTRCQQLCSAEALASQSSLLDALCAPLPGDLLGLLHRRCCVAGPILSPVS